jgi:hypothetical protein
LISSSGSRLQGRPCAPATDTADPPASPIWTADYVNARDSKLIAKTLTGSGSPTALWRAQRAPSSILPDFYWDYTNSDSVRLYDHGNVFYGGMDGWSMPLRQRRGPSSSRAPNTSYGQSRVWGVWNAYNRQPIYMKAGDSTGSWSYTTNGYRSANNSNANSVTTLTGLTEETVELRYQSFITSGSIANNNSTGGSIAIALNGSRVGTFGQFQFSQSSGGTINSDNQSLLASHHGLLAAGMNQAIAQESGLGVTGATFTGTESFMKLSAQYRA